MVRELMALLSARPFRLARFNRLFNPVVRKERSRPRACLGTASSCILLTLSRTFPLTFTILDENEPLFTAVRSVVKAYLLIILDVFLHTQRCPPGAAFLRTSGRKDIFRFENHAAAQDQLPQSVRMQFWL